MITTDMEKRRMKRDLLRFDDEESKIAAKSFLYFRIR